MTAVPVGSEFIVNTIPDGDQYRPLITRLATGGFLIGWQDASALAETGTTDDVRFARYDALGNRIGGVDTLVNASLPAAQFEASASAFSADAAPSSGEPSWSGCTSTGMSRPCRKPLACPACESVVTPNVA